MTRVPASAAYRAYRERLSQRTYRRWASDVHSCRYLGVAKVPERMGRQAVTESGTIGELDVTFDLRYPLRGCASGRTGKVHEPSTTRAGPYVLGAAGVRRAAHPGPYRTALSRNRRQTVADRALPALVEPYRPGGRPVRRLTSSATDRSAARNRPEDGTDADATAVKPVTSSCCRRATRIRSAAVRRWSSSSCGSHA